ncbi:MAG: DUF4349 domain-containing protein [Acaryochloris sp. RU_4_1]|nr:DUF4349 domain-containing protein [Acaryochloris sp. RU_4_1]NJR55860.1 DUF4349 domain-containing protein [Acaryochloris sp. CRU_2_0]
MRQDPWVKQLNLASLLGAVLAALMLSNCAAPSSQESADSGAAPLASQASSSAPITSSQEVPQAKTEVAQADSTTNALENNISKPATAAEVPQAKPQLIKRAQMTLRVDKVDPIVKAVAKVVQAHQGEVVGLQDRIPPDASIRHVASLELRIPQAKLDPTLEQLAKLGTVQNRSLSAEDVSSQLVDFQARLKNLRKSEEVTLKIMDRSGSIADVLKVSQELRTIRESIEQIEGQRQSLQTQVAYSTVNLTLEAAIATTPPQLSLGDQLQEAWSQSTHALVNPHSAVWREDSGIRMK